MAIKHIVGAEKRVLHSYYELWDNPLLHLALAHFRTRRRQIDSLRSEWAATD